MAEPPGQKRRPPSAEARAAAAARLREREERARRLRPLIGRLVAARGTYAVARDCLYNREGVRRFVRDPSFLPSADALDAFEEYLAEPPGGFGDGGVGQWEGTMTEGEWSGEESDADLLRRYFDLERADWGAAFLLLYHRHRGTARSALEAAGMAPAAAEMEVDAVFKLLLRRGADFDPARELADWLRELAVEVTRGPGGGAEP